MEPFLHTGDRLGLLPFSLGNRSGSSPFDLEPKQASSHSHQKQNSHFLTLSSGNSCAFHPEQTELSPLFLPLCKPSTWKWVSHALPVSSKKQPGNMTLTTQMCQDDWVKNSRQVILTIAPGNREELHPFSSFMKRAAYTLMLQFNFILSVLLLNKLLKTVPLGRRGKKNM
jgi:hypothetical protein